MDGSFIGGGVVGMERTVGMITLFVVELGGTAAFGVWK